MLMPSPATLKLLKCHFKAHGWEILETEKAFEKVCIAEKRDIKLVIRCVDQSFQKYRSVSHFVDRLWDYHTQYRNRSGEGIIYVINEPIVGLALDSLINLEVSLVLVGELSLLTGLERFYDEPPPPPEARERLILKGCPMFCIAIAESVRSKGNLDAAVQWLQMAMDDTRIVRDVHYKLIDCYIRAGDLSSARASIEKMLPFQPQNVMLLERLNAVELASKNPLAAQAVEKRIAAIKRQRPSFDKLMERQKAANPAARPPRAAEPPSQPSDDQHRIKRFFFWRE